MGIFDIRRGRQWRVLPWEMVENNETLLLHERGYMVGWYVLGCVCWGLNQTSLER